MSDKGVIYRQDAIAKLKEHRKIFCKNRLDFTILPDKDKARVDEIDACISTLINLPPAQPERKKGMWIHDGRDFPHGVDWIHCSVCGKKRINVPADLTSFCPNCGADMREGQDG